MDHEDNGPIVIGVTWMLSGLSAGFLGLRVYAKLSRRQGLWLDDYILILSWVGVYEVLDEANHNANISSYSFSSS